MTQVRVIVGALDNFTAKKVVELTLACQANLIETTPYDTGWARANWVPRIGKPLDTPVGSRDSIDSSAQQQGLAAVVSSYKSIDQGPVFISNNVPYIVPLNEGHSKQAPPGFVQAAVKKAVEEVG